MSKIEFVVTARPSWARAKSLILETGKLVGNDNINLTFLGPATSRYQAINHAEFENFEYALYSTLQESDSLSSIALSCVAGAQRLAQKWDLNRPKLVFIVADRTETLGVSLTSSLMQIPLVHLQGGEVSGSIDDKVRDINTKMADLHLTTNSYTRQNLLRLGEREENIRVIGCPSIDLVKRVTLNASIFEFSTKLQLEKFGLNLDSLVAQKFGIILFHPDTLDVKQSLEWIESLFTFVTRSSRFWIWLWPNYDHGSADLTKFLRQKREMSPLSNCKFINNLPPENFIFLAHRAHAILGNSSFGIREASFLGLPSVNLGNRQRFREQASNVLNILEPRTLNLTDLEELPNRFEISYLYGEGNAGIKGAEILSRWEPQLKSRVRTAMPKV